MNEKQHELGKGIFVMGRTAGGCLSVMLTDGQKCVELNADLYGQYGTLVFIPDKPKPEPDDIDLRLAKLCGLGVIDGGVEPESPILETPHIHRSVTGTWHVCESGHAGYGDIPQGEVWSPTTNRRQFDKFVEPAMWRRDVYLDIYSERFGPNRDVRYQLAWEKCLEHGWRKLSGGKAVDPADRLPAACRTALAAVEKLEKENKET